MQKGPIPRKRGLEKTGPMEKREREVPAPTSGKRERFDEVL